MTNEEAASILAEAARDKKIAKTRHDLASFTAEIFLISGNELQVTASSLLMLRSKELNLVH